MGNGHGPLKVFATTAGVPLAAKVWDHLSCKPGLLDSGRFKDGEISVQIGEDVRDCDVFIIAPTNVPADNFMEAMLLCQAARLSSADRITMVVPYLGYARGDRKDQPRKPISAKLALQMLELPKPNRFIFLDMHNEQTLGALDTVFDHLYGSAVAVPHLKALLAQSGKPYIVAAPDAGAAQRADKYAHFLSGGDADIVIFSKMRPKPGEIRSNSVKIIGPPVKGKIVVLVDDMIDSGGTIAHAAAKAKEKGAAEVWVFATHAVFSHGAFKRLRESKVDRVFVTDSIHHDPDLVAKEGGGKIAVLSCGELLAKAIHRTHEGESLSQLIL